MAKRFGIASPIVRIERQPWPTVGEPAFRVSSHWNGVRDGSRLAATTGLVTCGSMLAAFAAAVEAT
jgi:hypothetical protein